MRKLHTSLRFSLTFLFAQVFLLFAVQFRANAQTVNVVSGNVFNDYDGDKVIDSGEAFSISFPAPGLYVHVVNSSNTVVNSVVVSENGFYRLTIGPLGNYTLVLSTIQYGTGTNIATINRATPTDWVRTGENGSGDNTGSGDGTPDGMISVSFTQNCCQSRTNRNFGIQRPPVADEKNYQVSNSSFSSMPPAGFPPIDMYWVIPASSANLTGYVHGGSLSGSDPDDCPGDGDCNSLTSTTFNIETINANTILYYDYGAVTGVQQVVEGSAIANFDVSKLMIYAVEGSGTGGDPIGFTYSMTDKAGAESTAVSYLIETVTPLPVKLIRFDVSEQELAATLSWITSEEENSRGFEIQRSTNASSWINIGYEVSQSVNTEQMNGFRYTFTDRSPLMGVNYYRLKMIDQNGTFAYSPIRSVTMSKSKNNLIIYPNPVTNGSLALDVSGDEACLAEVYSMSGVRILQQDLRKGQRIDVSGLVKGIYLLRLSAEGGTVKTSEFIVK